MDATQAEIVKELLARVGSARAIEMRQDGCVRFRVGQQQCSMKVFSDYVWLCVVLTPECIRCQIKSDASELRKLYDAVVAHAAPLVTPEQAEARRILASLRPWWRRWLS